MTEVAYGHTGRIGDLEEISDGAHGATFTSDLNGKVRSGNTPVVRFCTVDGSLNFNSNIESFCSYISM
jgi:hypothetical protein